MKISIGAVSLGVRCKTCNEPVVMQNDAAYAAARKHGVLCASCRGGVAQKWTRATYAEYLKTDHWKRTKDGALKRAGYKCQVCAETFRLQVHHNDYSRLGGEKNTDLVVLCSDCHKTHHGIDL